MVSVSGTLCWRMLRVRRITLADTATANEDMTRMMIAVFHCKFCFWFVLQSYNRPSPHNENNHYSKIMELLLNYYCQQNRRRRSILSHNYMYFCIMENKIKILYILSIAAILAFLGMQAYWLYGRYEYSISEYENISCEKISNAIVEYNNERAKHSAVKKIARTQSSYQMNTDIDSVGIRRRTVSITTKEIDGRKILGISEKRDLTPEEMKTLQEMILDSLDMVDEKVATVDASTAPSDGIAWNAMRNFDNEIQSPFTAEG